MRNFVNCLRPDDAGHDFYRIRPNSSYDSHSSLNPSRHCHNISNPHSGPGLSRRS